MTEKYHVRFPGLGWEFDISNVAFTLGKYPVYWYGLIIATGLLLAMLYAWRSGPRYKVDVPKLFNCVMVGIFTGIAGARLYFCIFQWESYASDPISIFYIHEGGLAIYGGHHNGRLSARTGNRTLGQLYEPGGVRRQNRSALENDQRKHLYRRSRFRGASLLPL